MSNETRTFESSPAVRRSTPLWVGLVSPSGAGKTFSALRLATGMQRVSGGTIALIDTEACRGLHYADDFKYEHTPFAPMFGPLDYLAAIRHVVSRGARTVIIDSMSHEHEGEGGVLEQHEAMVQKLSGGDWKKAERVNMLAWAAPKAARQKLVQAMLQMQVNFILCFRAKEKLRIVKGEEPEKLGWMPIGAESLVYEMTMKCLLLPGADGYPSWTSQFSGEKAMMKLPRQFREMFAGEKPVQLSESIGETLARWSAGTVATPSADILRGLEACESADALTGLQAASRASWGTYSADEKSAVNAATKAAKARIAAGGAA